MELKNVNNIETINKSSTKIVDIIEYIVYDGYIK